MSRTARVVLYGRPGCHLCEQAAEVIARVCDDLGETWVEVSIDDDDRRCARSTARRSP